MVFVRNSTAVPLFVGGIIVLVVFFRLHGGLRIRRNLALIKANLDRQRELRRTKRISDNLEVRVSRLSTVNELWTLFEDLAQQFDLKVLELQLPHLSQSTDYYRYQLPSAQPAPQTPTDNLTVRIPFRLGTTGPGGELYAEVPIHGNAEAAAGKVQHLSRLMDCVRARPLFPDQHLELFDTTIPQETQTPQMISVG